MTTKKKTTKFALFAGLAALTAVAPQIHAESSSDALINKLEQKGILTADEAKELRVEAEQSETNLINQLPASKWKIANSIKSIGLFGDVRLRYEYRGADNPILNPGTSSGSGTLQNTYERERFRYAVRFGIQGDLMDDWIYGVRLETSSNPRSQFVTFADDTGNTVTQQTVNGVPVSPVKGGTPSDKSSDGIYVGQVYVGWKPTSWLEIMVGKMPQPLYTSSMVWSTALSPEGAFEKVKHTFGPVDVFADFGQFDYQNPNPSDGTVVSDTFLLANQIGAKVHMGKSMSFEIAPVVYVYAGHGNPAPPNTVAPAGAALNNSIYYPFVGQGDPAGSPTAGLNDAYNQIGINDLLIVEIPAEFDFKIYHTPLGTLQARIFGDLAYNYEGDDRARAAYAAGSAGSPSAFPGVASAVTGQSAAYQIGIGLGSDGPTYGPMQGLVYGTTSQKGAWEARFYWQHVDQYALDVNLMDADFFEGRANLQGFYSSFAYGITDAMIGTVRYGTANPINSNLGTGGSNPDLPNLNPIRNYQLVQADLTWRF